MQSKDLSIVLAYVCLFLFVVAVFLFVIPAKAGICFSTHTAGLANNAGCPIFVAASSRLRWASPKATFAGCA
jgi:hypothetical protein